MENCYADDNSADAYAGLGFANTYHLAFRDIPAIVRQHVRGGRAPDFGCETAGVDIAPEMVAKAHALDPGDDYRPPESTAVHRPLATGNGPYAWVSETTIAPRVLYVLTR
jgi:hypothetical protein